MFDFSNFVHDSWNAMATLLATIAAFLHISQNKKIKALDEVKVSKDIYEAEKKIGSPLEKKIDKIETYVKLLLDKNGIKYYD